MSHKKIEKECAKKLDKDAKHYKSEMKSSKGMEKKHEKTEMKEAKKGASVMKKLAKKSYEY